MGNTNKVSGERERERERERYQIKANSNSIYTVYLQHLLIQRLHLPHHYIRTIIQTMVNPFHSPLQGTCTHYKPMSNDIIDYNMTSLTII